nr:extracellular solute-binding protein [Paenibacillus sp. NEAU-GSW1]
MDAEQFERLLAANDRFMAKFPNVRVKLSNIDNTEIAYAVWKEQFQVGEAPDVVLMDSGWVAEFAVGGFLMPIDSLGKAEGISDHSAKLRASLLWNSYLWGVPTDADPSMLVWNKAMLASAGIDVPPNDWESYIALVEHLKQSDAGTSAVSLYPGEVDQLLVWLDAWTAASNADAAYLPAAGDKSRNERLRWLNSIDSQRNIFRLSNRVSLGSELEKHHLLCAVVRWSDYNALPKEEQNKLLIEKSEPRHIWLNSRSYVVASSTQSAEQAFAWINEMTSANEQQQGYQLFGRLPADNSLYDSAGSLSLSSSVKPPSWWLPLMNDEPLNTPPDPNWHERRKNWEELWRQYEIGAIDMESFIERVQQPL